MFSIGISLKKCPFFKGISIYIIDITAFIGVDTKFKKWL